MPSLRRQDPGVHLIRSPHSNADNTRDSGRASPLALFDSVHTHAQDCSTSCEHRPRVTLVPFMADSVLPGEQLRCVTQAHTAIILPASPVIDGTPNTLAPVEADATLWYRRADKALHAIREGRFTKLVLSQAFSMPVPAGWRINRAATLSAAASTGQCTPLLWCGHNQNLLSFTPERLFRLTPKGLHTHALAGTSNTRIDPANPGQRLAGEHQIVVENLVQNLRRWGEPEVGHVQLRPYGPMFHLETPIFVPWKSDPPDWQAVARLLHPSPAVGGMPQREAQEWLNLHEPFRGYYTGMAVVEDTVRGIVEAFVLLRTAWQTGNTLTLYAGAGLTEHSDPASEWQEILQKRDSIARQIHWIQI